jgi:hypothetical protein
MAALAALLLSIPGSSVALLLGAAGLGVATVKARAVRRLRAWHVLLLAALATALVPRLRRLATSGLRGLVAFARNVAGLATGRLKVVDIGGQQTLVEAR